MTSFGLYSESGSSLKNRHRQFRKAFSLKLFNNEFYCIPKTQPYSSYSGNFLIEGIDLQHRKDTALQIVVQEESKGQLLLSVLSCAYSTEDMNYSSPQIKCFAALAFSSSCLVLRSLLLYLVLLYLGCVLVLVVAITTFFSSIVLPMWLNPDYIKW